ncbi:MAG: metallophosphoesterase [Terracidiphilus sp.]|jgi:predicted MPP superfamily phosphohydrolase
MAVSQTSPRRTTTRRKFLKGGLIAAAGLAVYAGEIERHYIDVTHHVVAIEGLPAAFEGARIAQVSDIHLDEFTEPLFLDYAIKVVNDLNADYVVLTGDYVSHEFGSMKFARGSAWQCANMLRNIKCSQRYAILGNHDALVGSRLVQAALNDNGIPALVNTYTPLERAGSRIWLAGLDDTDVGRPRVDLAIPERIRGIADEPVILLCHEPDYADKVVASPAGQAVALMLSGHTHGGQVRFPLIPPFNLPKGGRKYVEGWFRFGNMQLYVNRGLGTIGVPFRFNCPPEISVFTLHRAEAAA